MTQRNVWTTDPDAALESKPMSVLDVLRAATSERHRQLERVPINARLLQNDLQIAEYRTTLVRLYGFYEPLSVHAQESGATWARHLTASVRELALDLLDLNVLAPEAQTIARCDDLPPLTTADHALGCGYVVEGSALGGRVICRHLSEVFADQLDVPLRFFAGSGTRTSERWRRFCTELNATADDVDKVCASARATFDAMTGWLQSAPARC